MNGKKSRSIRRAAFRATRNNQANWEGYQDETWHFHDQNGTRHLGRCLRRVYQIAKKNYKKAKSA